MTAIPAVVAGVPEPVILTPPGPDGDIDPATLVAARLAGVEKIAKAGGAQAVAAAAFGTKIHPEMPQDRRAGQSYFVAPKGFWPGISDRACRPGPARLLFLPMIVWMPD